MRTASRGYEGKPSLVEMVRLAKRWFLILSLPRDTECPASVPQQPTRSAPPGLARPRGTQKGPGLRLRWPSPRSLDLPTEGRGRSAETRLPDDLGGRGTQSGVPGCRPPPSPTPRHHPSPSPARIRRRLPPGSRPADPSPLAPSSPRLRLFSPTPGLSAAARCRDNGC